MAKLGSGFVLDGSYVQVGDANKDHACWERPEGMDTPRNVFKVDQNSPGSDIAAETAAAFASASLIFRRSDPTLANVCIHKPNLTLRLVESVHEAKLKQ